MKLFAAAGKAGKGTTLIEILIGVVVTLALFGLLIVGYRSFNIKRTLKLEAREVKSFFNLARGRAIHGEKPTDCVSLQGYRVGQEGSQELFSQPQCASGGGEKTILQLEKAQISSSDLPVTFAALTGKVEHEARVQLDYQGQSMEVVIAPSGLVE